MTTVDWQAGYRMLEAELATARAARERAHRLSVDRYTALCDQVQMRAQAERELDTALARVKDLEAQLSKADEATLELAVSRQAAETALASARAAVGRVAEYVGYLEQDIAAARKNREPQTGMHVPYHGAFCSAPISTIKDLERFARSMRDLLTSHPAPVAAPCAELTRWKTCPAEPEEDDDGPLYQGFLTDPAGAWVMWEDVARVLGVEP